MSDTTVTVVDPPEGDPPSTPDTVAETAVAAIGESTRAAADAGAQATRAQDASFNATDAESRAREHAEAAQRSEQAISGMVNGFMDAVNQIPVKISETLQSLVTNTPAAETPPEPETPKTPVKPKQHWANRKVFGGGKS